MTSVIRKDDSALRGYYVQSFMAVNSNQVVGFCITSVMDRKELQYPPTRTIWSIDWMQESEKRLWRILISFLLTIHLPKTTVNFSEGCISYTGSNG